MSTSPSPNLKSEIHKPEIRPWGLRGWIAPAVLALLAVAALRWDLDLARWCLGEHCPGGLRKLFGLCEVFGHGIGVLLLILVIYQLDPARRWALPRLACCAFAAGMAANALKLVIARTRPFRFDFTGATTTTFGDWLPGAAVGHSAQSFPSAHTATAVALAAALVWLYPRGRRLFPALAVLVAAQRIDSGAHFLSDALAGAAVGALVATAFLKYGHLPALFARWETAWAARAVQSTANPPGDGCLTNGS